MKENRFNWQRMPDNKALRTHDTKDFAHPTDPSKRIRIQNSGLFHAHVGGKFVDIKIEMPSYKFPEGFDITEPGDHAVLELPEWGDVYIEEGGERVRVYDEIGRSIFLYKDLRFKFMDQEVARNCKFKVKGRKLCVTSPSNRALPLKVYDDTDTNSTNNGDCKIVDSQPDTNKDGGKLQIDVQNATPILVRSVMDWTLSSGSGTISDVKLYLYCINHVSSSSGLLIEAHELTQAFVEAQVTWNSYSTGNNWSTAGGDFNATVIDTIANDSQSAIAWNDPWVLMGSGATYPLTLTWEDNFDILLKFDNETWQGARDLNQCDDKEAGGNDPYLEITYTPAGANLAAILPYLY